MYETDIAERYVQALINEISDWQVITTPGAIPATIPATIDTLYFGGGTPSLLSISQLERVLAAVHSRFTVAENAEVTIEMNPGDAEGRSDKLAGWRSLGINRVSFGAQTFEDEGLRQLGRTHTADDIRRTFLQLREAGFENINFDLIAGLSGQTLAGWEQNLAKALSLRPEHLSLYLLEVHEGTPLADQIKRGMRLPVDDDLTAEMYRVMIDRLCNASYEYYEISNFCRPGYEARHNTKYWTGAPYYGFGCSAHSFDGERRRWANERDGAGYIRLINGNESPITETIELTEHDAQAESMFLGLRMMSGLDSRVFASRFGNDPRETYRDDLERFGAAGLVEVDGDLIRLTRNGALLSNEVFTAFV